LRLRSSAAGAVAGLDAIFAIMVAGNYQSKPRFGTELRCATSIARVAMKRDPGGTPGPVTFIGSVVKVLFHCIVPVKLLP
jgi:hypothetical protein